MKPEDLDLLHRLLTRQRVLALSVLVDDKPYVGQLPFAVLPDFTALLIHASGLARHSKGLFDGAPFAAMVQEPDTGERDPFQLARVSLRGTVRPIERSKDDYALARETFATQLPTSAPTFGLGDFTLHRLVVEDGRFVAGFARAFGLAPRVLRGLANLAS